MIPSLITVREGSGRTTKTVNVPGKFECDTIQAWYIIIHCVLRADCIIVAPVDTILFIDVNI